MGGAPPLPHDFARRTPKKVAFSRHFWGEEPPDLGTAEKGPAGGLRGGSVTRLGRMAQSPRGTRDLGVAEGEGSGSPNTERDETRPALLRMEQRSMR